MELPIGRENPEQISGKKRRAAAKLGGKPGLDFWQKLEWILPVWGKTWTGFLAKTGMDSPGWSENPDWISGKNWNGFSRLERKPGLDFPGKLEWILPVGAKTRTGFLAKTGMDSPGWSENPDWIFLENWNGFSRLEQKPGLDFWQKLEWILPVGVKTRTGFPGKNWNGFSRLERKPGLDFLENWNGFSRLERKPGLDFLENWNGFSQLEQKPGLDFWQKLEWILPVGAKTRTGFLAKTGMDSPGWSKNPDWIPPGKLEWSHPVGGKTTSFLGWKVYSYGVQSSKARLF
ncbi:hypothetical protein DUI87_08779 [Hirundo rustica rustica]|uniref:Uncharacterized protein n=1 Tax=Hirundo rustica rustica TaxID=333673 RepID=A0A3M0KM49_HIRRU|nr:hypothetical protein DUI87_08779 [Hirundo rustica rustica]